MNFLKKIKALDRYDSILLAVFLIFIVFNLDVPDILGNMFEGNILAQLLLIGVALSLFVVSNPIVAVVGLLAVYELLRRSSRNSGGYKYGGSVKPITQSIPMELNNNYDDNSSTTSLNSLNNSPSLEEQVISNMAPRVSNENLGTPSYLPIIDSNINGTDINEPDVL